MQVQINTDSNIEGREKLAEQVTSVIESSLGRFSDRITRVEVHLSDQNSGKSGPSDKRCVIEARIKGRQPTVATHDAETVELAVDGAADKLERAIANLLDRSHDRR